jgi:hypothetical protein
MLNAAGSLADGVVPLEVYLSNAVALAGNRRETEVLAHALQSVRTRSLADARNKALQATAEAAATVAELRAIGASLAKISLTVLARAGIWGAFPWSNKLQLRAELASQLRALGVSQAEIENAEETLRALVRFRLGKKIAGLAKDIHEKASDPKAETTNDFAKRLEDLFDFNALRMPSARELHQQVDTFSSAEIEELLRDLDNFEQSGELRDLSVLDER